MSGPTDEPARGLADILREAGIDAAGTGGRRRRRDNTHTADDEDSDTTEAPVVGVGDGQRSTVQNAESDVGGLSAYFLTRSDLATPEHPAPGPPDAMAAPDPTAPAPKTATPKAATPKPPTPKAPAARAPAARAPTPKTAAARAPAARPRDRETPAIVPAALLPPRTDTGPVPTVGWSSRGTGWPESSTAASTTGGPLSTSLATASSPANQSAESTSTSGTSHANRSASPVATTPPVDDDEIDAGVPARGGVASWAILAVELLAALGLGVAAWYAFSAVWELLPYVAAFAGPLVVTGLVAVAGALRSRTGRNPLGLPTLCVLVFAGTVLVVLPAATVIIP